MREYSCSGAYMQCVKRSPLITFDIVTLFMVHGVCLLFHVHPRHQLTFQNTALHSQLNITVSCYSLHMTVYVQIGSNKISHVFCH